MDNGEGIPSDMLPHIFERTCRGDATRQQNAGETDLGLAIAKSIVEAHGQSISVQSHIDQGTRFVIRLSAADTPSPATH